MGWRFRKSLKILPGVRLNFGKGGLTSTTVGGKWFKTNLGGRGVKHTLSVPGTGVSYQTDAGRDAPSARKSGARSGGNNWLLVLLAVLLLLVLLAVVGVGVLVVMTRRPAARLHRAETPAPHVASKAQTYPALARGGRS